MRHPKPFNIATFLDAATIKPEELQLDELYSTALSWDVHAFTDANQTLDRIRNAELVVTNKVLLDEHTLSQAKNLKLICICATGTNNVDIQAARRLGISVCNVSGYAAKSVAQHTLSLILALATSLKRYDAAVQEGKWSQSKFFCMLDYPAFELSGKTLGIVGYGSLGQATAKLAKAFDMNVIVAQTPWSKTSEGREPWSDFLQSSDIVSIHCPLSEQSKHLFDQQTIAQMKPGALLINTARGGIVEEHALLTALQSGHLGGAALDVLEQEPPSSDHPLIKAHIPNLIITPHTAWIATECRQRLMDGVTKNISDFLHGNLQSLGG